MCRGRQQRPLCLFLWPCFGLLQCVEWVGIQPEFTYNVAMSQPRVQIREASPDDAAGIARVHVDTWQSAYKGIVPDDFLARLSYEVREASWKSGLSNPGNPWFVYVAQDSETGQVVGFASGGPIREPVVPGYEGELGALYVLQERQGQGIGKSLVRAVASRLRDMDVRSMMLWVLSDNEPARRFYEVIGGVKVADNLFEMGGAMLGEVAYGWGNTSGLIGDDKQ